MQLEWHLDVHALTTAKGYKRSTDDKTQQERNHPRHSNLFVHMPCVRLSALQTRAFLPVLLHVSVQLCVCITYTVLTSTTSCTKEMKNSDHSKFLVKIGSSVKKGVLTQLSTCTQRVSKITQKANYQAPSRPPPRGQNPWPPPSPPSPHHRTLPPPSPPSPPPSPAFSARTSSAEMFGPGGWPVTGRAKSGRIVLNARTCPHGSKLKYLMSNVRVVCLEEVRFHVLMCILVIVERKWKF